MYHTQQLAVDVVHFEICQTVEKVTWLGHVIRATMNCCRELTVHFHIDVQIFPVSLTKMSKLKENICFQWLCWQEVGLLILLSQSRGMQLAIAQAGADGCDHLTKTPGTRLTLHCFTTLCQRKMKRTFFKMYQQHLFAFNPIRWIILQNAWWQTKIVITHI